MSHPNGGVISPNGGVISNPISPLCIYHDAHASRKWQNVIRPVQNKHGGSTHGSLTNIHLHMYLNLILYRYQSHHNHNNYQTCPILVMVGVESRICEEGLVRLGIWFRVWSLSIGVGVFDHIRQLWWVRIPCWWVGLLCCNQLGSEDKCFDGWNGSFWFSCPG